MNLKKKKKQNTTKTRKEESNPWLELRHAHLEIRNAAWFSPSPRGWRCWQDPKKQLVRTHSLLNSKVWTQISTETGNGISHYRMGSVRAQDWHIWESWGSKEAPHGEGTTPGCVGIFPSQTRYVPFIPASKPRSAGPLTLRQRMGKFTSLHSFKLFTDTFLHFCSTELTETTYK